MIVCSPKKAGNIDHHQCATEKGGRRCIVLMRVDSNSESTRGILPAWKLKTYSPLVTKLFHHLKLVLWRSLNPEALSDEAASHTLEKWALACLHATMRFVQQQQQQPQQH